MRFADLENFDNVPHTSGVYLRYCCLLCGADKPRDRAHQCLSVRGQYYKCFRCGEAGQFEDMKLQRTPIKKKIPAWMEYFK